MSVVPSDQERLRAALRELDGELETLARSVRMTARLALVVLALAFVLLGVSVWQGLTG